MGNGIHKHSYLLFGNVVLTPISQVTTLCMYLPLSRHRACANSTQTFLYNHTTRIVHKTTTALEVCKGAVVYQLIKTTRLSYAMLFRWKHIYTHCIHRRRYRGHVPTPVCYIASTASELVCRTSLCARATNPRRCAPLAYRSRAWMCVRVLKMHTLYYKGSYTYV